MERKMNNALRLSRLVLQSVSVSIRSSILICHGLLGSKQNWKSISKALAQNNCGTVVAVDLRNHGSSPHSDYMSYLHMAEDILAVVDDLSLQNVCLVGHSMGGKAVMCAALMRPEKYNKLVVIDISPKPKSAVRSLTPLVDLMSSVNLQVLGHKYNGNISLVRNSLIKEWSETVSNPTMLAFILTNLIEKNGEILWKVNLSSVKNCWNQIASFPTELDGRVYSQPVLFIAASDETYLGQSDVPAIRKYFPQAKILRIANTGHWVHFDAPNTVINLITTFILEKPFDLTSFTDVTELI
ncbi:Protein ABHD11 [Schistosoma japonicum]|uniref:sn-1-specific diacylglycerol lipase ABHD11 n=2 Tax=Schistosoma japonicum TaxID=6182 RepID=A0A4Z2DH54_SCHJA|nr:Protein ABHD11 [Schistosoma japonicum]TNN15824.1 Protein ABHD11 [Schistosoma japonicum]